MEVLLCWVSIYLQLLHLLLGLNLSSSCSVCLCLFSVFKVYLSDMNFTIPDFFQFQFTWTTFFHPHTFNLYVSLDLKWVSCSVQFSLVTQSCPTLCDPMNRSMPGLPVHHQLLESTQIHVHIVGDAIQPSHSLLFPSPPAFNNSQHQGIFQWVSSSHQVAKALEFQLQHQPFQWIFRTDFL